jgi:hypothetical protein
MAWPNWPLVFSRMSCDSLTIDRKALSIYTEVERGADPIKVTNDP